MESETYIPGVCNITPTGATRRRQGGIAAAIISVALAAYLFLFHFPPAYRLLLFFPVTAAAISLLQAHFHFCVAYGFSGTFKVLASAGKTESVQTAEFRRIDRRKAAAIIGGGMLVGLTVALIAYFA